ncbi:hypothetical protein M1N56_05990 [Dehalococcoidia bacterium]|nr:hypothetical protein [Dehalococcoidia bacterium]
MALIKRIFDQALKRAGVSSTNVEGPDSSAETVQVEPAQPVADPTSNPERISPSGTSLESDDLESLWDLSELDPEIYEGVFQAGDSPGSPESTSDEDESIVEGTVVSRVQRSDPPGNRAIAARVQRVSVDDDDQTEEPDVGMREEEDVLETEVAPAEEQVGNVMELEDGEDNEVSALFGEKVEVRPQVKQLLDKYGTVPAEQLLREVQDTRQLLLQDDPN